MKNSQVNSGDIVPLDIRLEVYKEVLKNTKWQTNEYGLCYLLPMALWGFPDSSTAYYKLDHCYWTTVEMFPELREQLKYITGSLEDSNTRRKQVLRRMIKTVNNLITE